MSMHTMTASCLATAVLLALAGIAHAVPTPSYGFITTGASFPSVSLGTIGYRFTTSGTLLVTALGVVDEGSNGLFGSHPVGIWTDGGGGPLASTIVPSGAAATLIDGFRYEDIPA